MAPAASRNPPPAPACTPVSERPRVGSQRNGFITADRECRRRAQIRFERVRGNRDPDVVPRRAGDGLRLPVGAARGRSALVLSSPDAAGALELLRAVWARHRLRWLAGGLIQAMALGCRDAANSHMGRVSELRKVPASQVPCRDSRGTTSGRCRQRARRAIWWLHGASDEPSTRAGRHLTRGARRPRSGAVNGGQGHRRRGSRAYALAGARSHGSAVASRTPLQHLDRICDKRCSAPVSSVALASRHVMRGPGDNGVVVVAERRRDAVSCRRRSRARGLPDVDQTRSAA